MADLSRFWLQWKGSLSTLIIGDYHVTSGQGMGVWTLPSYFNGYDSPGQYRRSGRDITVSNYTAVNSSLRGIASIVKRGNISLNLYASKRRLGAIVEDSTGSVLRLSDGGYHRSEGERAKYNSLSETLIGSEVQYITGNNYFHEINIHAGGYLARYDPPFQQAATERTRFPFTGTEFGSAFGGAALAADQFIVRGNAATDRNGNVAWKAGVEYYPLKKSNPRILIDLYNYPVKFKSPRAIAPLNRPNSTGRFGGALLVSGRLRGHLVSSWSAHLDIMRKPWRSFLFPMPMTESKASMTIALNLSPTTEQVIRIRRKNSEKKVDERNRRYTEHKIRFTEKFRLNPSRYTKLQLWEEFARLDFMDGRAYQGGMLGFKIDQRLRGISNLFANIDLSALIAAFNTEDHVSIYLGERDIPYRISSVRLSGKGVRYAASLTLEFGKLKWIAVKIAQTNRFQPKTDNPDLELVLSASYTL